MLDDEKLVVRLKMRAKRLNQLGYPFGELELTESCITAIEQLQAENAQLHAIMALLDSCNSDEGIVLAMQCDYAAMKGANDDTEV